ncbi:MAG TPA: single-stranded-DNA-specific exonuclease RecJ [Candidatus Paceibacterota bacterium]|nr:single-stranded-DNA-specific exonuclease RecJ [Candidatus Paceibacterota bacterium]
MKSYRLRERAHDELLPDLMLARGVVGDEAQKQFLAPDFERDSGDPFLLPDMDKAVDRILSAVKNAEAVCVWSDYDCDGIPGGVMLTEFLRSIGLTVRHYIPHRHTEGYGLNEEGIEELVQQGIKLIITIDLGTTEIEQIAYANSKGVDVIVTDHHIVQDDLPDAFALLNPKRPDSAYPFDGLCGAGVAWKLVQATLARLRASDNQIDWRGFPEGQEKWLLDLVGIATLSDMVPLVGENRMLAHFGLRVLRRDRRPGLSALLKLLRIKPSTLTEDDIGFMVSPRINAASRMDKPDTAARLLATSNAVEASDIAFELNRINDERKGVVAAIVKEANKRMEDMPADGPVIVMGNPKWRPGVLGLVANSLMEAQGKPAFLWGREGGETIKGSCRSDGSVSVVDLMAAAGDVFLGFGGHTASGGFSVDAGRVHELLPRLTSAYEMLRAKASVAQDVVIDRQADLSEISHAHRDLVKLAPFGIGNSKPLFMFPDVSIGNTKMFGKTNNHLDMSLEKGGSRISGIAFFSGHDSFTKKVEKGARADIVGHIESDWRGQSRIRVVDIL